MELPLSVRGRHGQGLHASAKDFSSHTQGTLFHDVLVGGRGGTRRIGYHLVEGHVFLLMLNYLNHIRQHTGFRQSHSVSVIVVIIVRVIG